MMNMEAFTKIINFMTPKPGASVLRHAHFANIIKMHYHYFFQNLPLNFWLSCRQTEYKVMMSMKAYIKVVNFVTPRARVLCQLGRSHIGHILKMHYFFEDLVYF